MISDPSEAAIDQIVASCNGDIRGALKALLLVNEQLEAELQQFYAAVGLGMARTRRAGFCTESRLSPPDHSVRRGGIGSSSGQASMVERASLASSIDL